MLNLKLQRKCYLHFKALLIKTLSWYSWVKHCLKTIPLIPISLYNDFMHIKRKILQQYTRSQWIDNVSSPAPQKSGAGTESVPAHCPTLSGAHCHTYNSSPPSCSGLEGEVQFWRKKQLRVTLLFNENEFPTKITQFFEQYVWLSISLVLELEDNSNCGEGKNCRLSSPSTRIRTSSLP